MTQSKALEGTKSIQSLEISVLCEIESIRGGEGGKKEIPGVVEKEGEIASEALSQNPAIIDDLCCMVRPRNLHTGPP